MRDVERIVTARVDKDGEALSKNPGDVTGASKPVVPPNDHVTISLDILCGVLECLIVHQQQRSTVILKTSCWLEGWMEAFGVGTRWWAVGVGWWV